MTVTASPLGDYARVLALPAGTTIQLTVGITPSTGPTGPVRLVNRNSGKVLDVSGGSTAGGASIIQWPPNSGANQEWQPITL